MRGVVRRRMKKVTGNFICMEVFLPSDVTESVKVRANKTPISHILIFAKN
jgi:hypothetical protein